MPKGKYRRITIIVVLTILIITSIIFPSLYFFKKTKPNRTLRNLPLPVKMLYYYEYVRQSLPWGLTNPELESYFVLHDTGQFNYFENIDEELGDIWQTNNSITEFEEALKIFYNWQWLWKNNFTSYFLFNNLINRIDYFWDDSFTEGTNRHYDFAKSAIETIFSGRGDCDDQTILAATFLEASGYETIIGYIGDDNETGVQDDFYHAFLWVKVENFSYPYLYADLWRFGVKEYEWLLLDPTWNIEYGYSVDWIIDYDVANFTRWEEIFQWNVVAPPGDSANELNELIPSHE